MQWPARKKYFGYKSNRLIGEEVFVPTFTIDAAADWKINYARDSRIDIAQRAAARVAKDLANYEEELVTGSLAQ